MKYALVINAFAPDAKKQAGKLAGFLTNNKLNTENGTCVILYDPENTETSELHAISAFVPAVRIFYVSFKEYLPENILPFLKDMLSDMDCILFPGSYFGDELSIRLSVRLGGSSLNGVQSVQLEAGKALVRKRIYSGHINGTFELHQKPYILAIDKNYAVGSQLWPLSEKELLFREPDTPFTNFHIEKSALEKESVLEEAHCIAVVGRGLKNKENTLETERLAKRINVPVTGSRPCVMNAWLPMSRLIGVSGTMIAPDVCILLGASGAPALYSGIEKSRYIISVNNDPDAPITKKADLAICGDAMEVFRAFVKLTGGDK